ncbi:rhodanese-like domain-containing protein [Aerococcaceae bacterium WGS1372]
MTRPAPEVSLVNIPLENLHNDYSILDAKSKIYTLCGSGNRATTATSFLIDKGYDVKVIDGGMKAMNEHLGKE